MEAIFLFCINCGASISDEAVFCPKCGNKVIMAPVAEPVAAPEPEPIPEPEYYSYAPAPEPEPIPEPEYVGHTPIFAPTPEPDYYSYAPAPETTYLYSPPSDGQTEMIIDSMPQEQQEQFFQQEQNAQWSQRPQEPQISQWQPTPQAPKKKKTNVAAIILIAVIVICAGAIIVLLAQGGFLSGSKGNTPVISSVPPVVSNTPASSPPVSGTTPPPAATTDITNQPEQSPAPVVDEQPSETPEVRSVKIVYGANAQEKTDVTIKPGEIVLFSAALEPVGVQCEIIWESSNEQVFTVGVANAEGGAIVKATDVGIAVLTVKAGDKTAECIIRVRKGSG